MTGGVSPPEDRLLLAALSGARTLCDAHRGTESYDGLQPSYERRTRCADCEADHWMKFGMTWKAANRPARRGDGPVCRVCGGPWVEHSGSACRP